MREFFEGVEITRKHRATKYCGSTQPNGATERGKPTNMNIHIALAQINVTVGAIDANRDQIIEAADRARGLGADIVVFPELAVTGYPPEDLLLKPHFIARNEQALKEIARQVNGVVAVVGFVEKGKAGLYNAAAVIAGGRVAGVYRKENLPNYSVFDEKRYFIPGEGGGLFSLNGITFGVTICEDIWVDNGPALRLARAGAKVILNLSSSPYEAGKREERLKLLRRRVKETGCAFAYVNLLGGQDELVFDGSSMIVSAKGAVLAEGRPFEPDMVAAALDVPAGKGRGAVVLPAPEKRAAVPVAAAVRPAALSLTEEMYAAVVLGTRDYIRKNGFKRVLIGLSGGIDSALVAAIAVDAVGRENVVGISMPTRFNVAATRQDARVLAENLGIEFQEIPIEPVLEAFLTALKPYFKDQPFGLAEENLQARIRGNMLMAFSNKFGWLLLTTGNKSEMATGYCTLYGDMSGGYAVIKDILKTQVYALSELVNTRAGRDIIPRTILTRAPSAELRPDQTDQDSLPPYATLDALLALYVEGHCGFKDLTRACGSDEIARKVVELVDKSEYKRRQAPPGVKISRRAFGKDWRLPLTNKYKEC